MNDINNIPVADFDGFTPFEMDRIIYFPFEDNCPIKMNILTKETIINQCPIFNILIQFLSQIGEGVKLTEKGNLPVKVIKDIYNLKILPDDSIERGIGKIRTETDWTVLHNVRIVLTMAGLIRKNKNLLFLTNNCKTFIKDNNCSGLFIEFMKAFTLLFSWAYNDLYENQDLGQLASLFSLYLINKHGEEFRDLDFYTNLYFSAFPTLVDNKETDSAALYHIRFVERFALWFGFVEEEIIKGKSYFDRRIRIKRTKLLQELLQVKSAPGCSIYQIN
jgi:hypothetical protein